jgi:hypothetical protein
MEVVIGQNGMPKLEDVSYEAVHDWLLGILVNPVEVADIIKYSGNPDLILGYVMQVLKYDRGYFLKLPNGKWFNCIGERVSFGVIQTFKDSEWHKKGGIILLNPYGGKADKYLERKLVFGPVTGLEDGEFMKMLSVEES